MRYTRVQFRDVVVVSKSPYLQLKEAESLDVPDLPPANAYLIEDDGPNHVRITKAVGGFTARVPWSSIVASTPAPAETAADPTRLGGMQVVRTPITREEAVASATLDEPKGFPVLPRVTSKAPRR